LTHVQLRRAAIPGDGMLGAFVLLGDLPSAKVARSQFVFLQHFQMQEIQQGLH